MDSKEWEPFITTSFGFVGVDTSSSILILSNFHRIVENSVLLMSANVGMLAVIYKHDIAFKKNRF